MWGGSWLWWFRKLPALCIASGLAVPAYWNNPGVATRSAKFDSGRVTYTVNSLGLRGPEIPLHKRPGEHRILILGDSVVFGAIVKDADTLSAQMQRMLPPNWTVLNGGIPGYDAWDYAGWFRAKGYALQPDIVIIGYFMNDHTRAREFAMQKQITRSYTWPWMTKPLTYQAAEKVVTIYGKSPRSAVSVMEFIRNYRYRPEVLLLPMELIMDEQRWLGIEAPLADIQRLCATKQIKLMASLWPLQWEVYPGYDDPEPRRTLSCLFARHSIPFVDFRQTFLEAERPWEMWPCRYDMAHPNAKAYGMAADALLPRLKGLGWVR